MKTSTVCKLSLLLVILAIGVLSPLDAQNPEAQFQQGLMKENGEGSLQEAIAIYQEISENEAASRPVRAEALLHLGLCYEKLGRTEAVKTYRKLIKNYPDQTETTKVARQKLSLLSQTINTGNRGSKIMNIRKIWEGADYLQGELSPDGRYLSFTDWETGDLAVYELSSGKTRRLTNKGPWEECSDYSEDSRWSPDSRQISYGWCDDTGAFDLRIIGLDGSGPDIIYKNKDVNYLVPCDWSPDGREILTILNFKDRTMQLVLIAVTDGSIRVLKTMNHRDWPGKMCFTKDGQYILYDRNQKEGTRVRDIFLLSINEGNEIPLVENLADDFLLNITPDGRHVLFSSDRDGTLGLYVISMEEGRSSGEPSLLKSGMGKIENLGCTPENSFYYGVSKESSDIYMFELDPASGNIIHPLSRFKPRYQGNNREPDYSPDGKRLAYIRVKNPSTDNTRGYTRGGDMLIIKDLETQEEKNIMPELYHIGFPRWSPDNKFIMIVEWGDISSMGYRKISVETGQMETILDPDNGKRLFGRHEWSPDGNTLYYGVFSHDFSSSRIISRELETGEEHKIYESKDILHLSLSPEGHKLAVLSKAKMARAYALHIVPVSGGEARELFRFNHDEKIDVAWASTCIWSKDGQFILFLLRDDNMEHPYWELCRIPSAGGQIEKLNIKIPGQKASGLCMHPDGRQMAFSSQISNILPAVWVMENFLPSD